MYHYLVHYFWLDQNLVLHARNTIKTRVYNTLSEPGSNNWQAGKPLYNRSLEELRTQAKSSRGCPCHWTGCSCGPAADAVPRSALRRRRNNIRASASVSLWLPWLHSLRVSSVSYHTRQISFFLPYCVVFLTIYVKLVLSYHIDDLFLPKSIVNCLNVVRKCVIVVRKCIIVVRKYVFDPVP